MPTYDRTMINRSAAALLGVGLFHARFSPLGSEQTQGLCIYDATAGSLRLTQRLAESFGDVVAAARDSASDDDEKDLFAHFSQLADLAGTLNEVVAATVRAESESADDDWVTLIAPGESAILVNAAGTQEVDVVAYRYTPRGLVYQLRHRTSSVTWTAPADSVQPVWGESKLIRVNLVTDEKIDLS